MLELLTLLLQQKKVNQDEAARAESISAPARNNLNLNAVADIRGFPTVLTFLR